MTSGPLIPADELRAALVGSGRLRPSVLDVRYRTGAPSGPSEFAAGHIPGAAYVDVDTELAAPPGTRGRHPLPAPREFEASMRRAGVSGGRPVVVYDDWGGRAAARVWWLLRLHGHRDVRVLDGAWPAWVAAGGDVETGTAAPGQGDFVVSTGSTTGGAGSTTEEPAMPVVDVDAVPRVDVLIDARAAERYRGEVEPIDRVAGHIPGAVNMPTESNLDSDGRFRPVPELAKIYAGVGAVPGADVAAYCGSGVTAAHDVLAMEVAGISAALYPGSWSEWIADPDRPIAP